MSRTTLREELEQSGEDDTASHLPLLPGTGEAWIFFCCISWLSYIQDCASCKVQTLYFRAFWTPLLMPLQSFIRISIDVIGTKQCTRALSAYVQQIRYLHHRMGPTSCIATQCPHAHFLADAFDELLQSWLHDGGERKKAAIFKTACPCVSLDPGRHESI